LTFTQELTRIPRSKKSEVHINKYNNITPECKEKKIKAYKRHTFLPYPSWKEGLTYKRKKTFLTCIQLIASFIFPIKGWKLNQIVLRVLISHHTSNRHRIIWSLLINFQLENQRLAILVIDSNQLLVSDGLG